METEILNISVEILCAGKIQKICQLLELIGIEWKQKFYKFLLKYYAQGNSENLPTAGNDWH